MRVVGVDIGRTFTDFMLYDTELRNANLRVLQDGEGAVGRELVLRTLENVVVREAWAGRATLELRPNAQVPVHRLVVEEIALGLHWLVDSPSQRKHSPAWRQRDCGLEHILLIREPSGGAERGAAITRDPSLP